MMNTVQIDRETALELMRVLSQPQRDPGVIVADRLREALRAALDAPQTPAVSGHGKLVDEILSIAHAFGDEGRKKAIRDLAMRVSNALAPPPPPDTHEAFEAWARTRYGLDDRALELSTDGHYLRSPVDVASEAFKAGFAAGRVR